MKTTALQGVIMWVINYAMNSLNPDYVLLLNNDTVVDKYFLRES